ncbi:thiosulfate oxidation carrier complex protein SoxZ [Comamonas fluminis]|uniref:thiosulfate oxidation carrier complex protein SoxZ n=1 Tax=Comamonas fluminis TaxID=2796366 RepID=UPI001C4608FE|nr:thiosulfate oxidation carrier complex protein SoxZ [Comamonas fluminis]
MSKPPRIWVSNATPKKGEVVRVRAQMEHVMESGLRTDPATGKVRPRNIVNRFEARLGSALLFTWEPGISIAQNPYIEFTFLARESGELNMLWKDEQGQTLNAQKAITVS